MISSSIGPSGSVLACEETEDFELFPQRPKKPLLAGEGALDVLRVWFEAIEDKLAVEGARVDGNDAAGVGVRYSSNPCGKTVL
jgi:hypothetical protein